MWINGEKCSQKGIDVVSKKTGSSLIFAAMFLLLSLIISWQYPSVQFVSSWNFPMEVFCSKVPGKIEETYFEELDLDVFVFMVVYKNSF